MKIKSEKPQEETRECVAYTFHMEGKPDRVGLVLKDPFTNKGFWLYHDGTTDYGYWEPEVALVKFYKGDTIEITF